MGVKHITKDRNGNSVKHDSLNMSKAIRLHCLKCGSFSSKKVKECADVNCALYPFRFGKDPSRSRNLTDEQKEALATRLKAMREAKKKSA